MREDKPFMSPGEMVQSAVMLHTANKFDTPLLEEFSQGVGDSLEKVELESVLYLLNLRLKNPSSSLVNDSFLSLQLYPHLMKSLR